MNLHEYQAKRLFSAYAIPVPAGMPAFNIDEARREAEQLGGDSWMIKAQVHAGGRGKAGGVKRAVGLDHLTTLAGELLGRRLVTHQTGPEGQPVHCLLLETPTHIEAELYLSMVLDRAAQRIAIIASSMGGMDIEAVAASQPDKVLTRVIHPATGLMPHQSQELAFSLGLDKEQRKQFQDILANLYRLFVEKDLNLAEINPLVITQSGDLLALDAKITLDDNALPRHNDLSKLYDPSQVDEKENLARQHDLSYIALHGDIACMVNGAGLAMATMDLIKLHGGEPANFLDVGGGTTAERVAEAFKLILSDKKVKAILVNIFGGIVRCDLIAEGIIQAVKETGLGLPVVVRLEGTNVELGRDLLQRSGLSIIAAEDLTDAARKVVAAAKAA
jgi:succinyl-CoA synthetase beta subunit